MEKPKVKKVKNIFSPQIQTFEPFGCSVDPSRSNMSSKQIIQSCPSRMSQVPYIINRVYKDFTNVKSPYFLRAPQDGYVLSVNKNIMFIYYTDPHDQKNNRIVFEYVPTIKKLMANALYIKMIRPVGPFKAGDLLYDYSGQTEEGLPKIGYRTNVMFSSFFGYTAEDAFVMSESYSRRAQIDYMDKLYIPITKKFRYLKNSEGKYFTLAGERQPDHNYLKYIKIDPTTNFDSQFLNISEEDSAYYTQLIEGLHDGEITEVKLHRINPKKFADVAKDYIYSPELIKEISEIYNGQYNDLLNLRDDYKRYAHVIGDPTQICNQLFIQYKSNPKLPAHLVNQIAENYMLVAKDIDYILEIDIVQTVPSYLGDKFANLFAGKGVCSLIIPDRYMPKDPEGNPVDIIFNPLGIYGRNNWGMIFEIGCSKIIENLQKDILSQFPDIDIIKEKLQFINDKFISRFDDEYSSKVQSLINDFENNFEAFRENVQENGFYLHVDNFPDITYKSFYEDFIEPYQKSYGIITEVTDYKFDPALMDWLKRERRFEVPFMNTEEVIESKSFFGCSYYLKLFHTAFSKYNSVGLASRYNKTSNQPARGRKAKGGVHISWQSVAADRGHSDDSKITSELLSIKADCLFDKSIFIDEITYTGEYYLKETGIKSKTHTVLIHVASILGITFDYSSDIIETSRQTEEQRIKIKQYEEAELAKLNISMNFEDPNSEDVSFLFNDDNLQELIRLEEDSSYIQDLISNSKID